MSEWSIYAHVWCYQFRFDSSPSVWWDRIRSNNQEAAFCSILIKEMLRSLKESHLGINSKSTSQKGKFTGNFFLWSWDDLLGSILLLSQRLSMIQYRLRLWSSRRGSDEWWGRRLAISWAACWNDLQVWQDESGHGLDRFDYPSLVSWTCLTTLACPRSLSIPYSFRVALRAEARASLLEMRLFRSLGSWWTHSCIIFQQRSWLMPMRCVIYQWLVSGTWQW